MGANNGGASVDALITIVVQHPLSLRKNDNKQISVIVYGTSGHLA